MDREFKIQFFEQKRESQEIFLNLRHFIVFNKFYYQIVHKT